MTERDYPAGTGPSCTCHTCDCLRRSCGAEGRQGVVPGRDIRAAATLDAVTRLTSSRLASSQASARPTSIERAAPAPQLWPSDDPRLRAALRHDLLRTASSVRQRSLVDFLR